MQTFMLLMDYQSISGEDFPYYYKKGHFEPVALIYRFT